MRDGISREVRFSNGKISRKLGTRYPCATVRINELFVRDGATRAPRLHRPAKYYFGNYGVFSRPRSHACSCPLAVSYGCGYFYGAKKYHDEKKKNNDTERSPQMKCDARKERAPEKFQTDCKSRLKLQRCARKNGNGHRFLFVGLVSRRYRNTSWINGQPFSDLTRTALFHPRVFYATFSTFLSLPASRFLILSSSFPLSSVLRSTVLSLSLYLFANDKVDAEVCSFGGK